MKKLPISVCMISGAEEKRIGKSLASVADWVSEIIVVLNDDVNDQTENIARSFGAAVFREPWKGHIAQKNSAAEKASQPWILGLDSDETITAELHSEIEMLCASPETLSVHAAYRFPRCTLFSGRWIRHGDWYPDLCTRLWRKDSAKWGGMDPHDKLEVQGSIGRLKGELSHYSIHSLNQQLGKIPSYSDYFLQQRLAAGRSAGWTDLVLRPWWTFLRGYFFRRGFLDGWQGYYIARMNAFTTLTRYTKLREAMESKKEA